MTFGECVNQYRKMRRISFAKFCNDLNFSKSNWFNVERNLAAHPRDKRIINQIADYLKLNDDNRKLLFDLANNNHNKNAFKGLNHANL